ncbi:hypothetical protein GCM10022278_13140 [Allohahella marinimesophila]|uniref:Uncharacterized protein n=1 Tax=Allohahella marinimesophila TaxID=1054972 RepID=A0ABP7NYN5_9GAMM
MPRITTSDIEGHETEGDGSKTGTQQGDYLRKEQMPISTVSQDLKHGLARVLTDPDQFLLSTRISHSNLLPSPHSIYEPLANIYDDRHQ